MYTVGLNGFVVCDHEYNHAGPDKRTLLYNYTRGGFSGRSGVEPGDDSSPTSAYPTYIARDSYLVKKLTTNPLPRDL